VPLALSIGPVNMLPLPGVFDEIRHGEPGHCKGYKRDQNEHEWIHLGRPKSLYLKEDK
jgi:hypothetical protein